MPVDVLTEIEIARPRAEVAAYASDPATAPIWYENIETVEWRSPRRRRRGRRLRRSPVDAILHFAEERKSNVVVIGAGGREGPRDYLVGSTGERIVRHSPVPVLVIR